MITFLFMQMVHGMGIMWLVLQYFPSCIVISTRLHYSASIFTAEVWANIKAHFRVSKLYNKLYEAGTSLDCDGDAKVCLFKFCQ